MLLHITTQTAMKRNPGVRRRSQPWRQRKHSTPELLYASLGVRPKIIVRHKPKTGQVMLRMRSEQFLKQFIGNSTTKIVTNFDNLSEKVSMQIPIRSGVNMRENMGFVIRPRRSELHTPETSICVFGVRR